MGSRASAGPTPGSSRRDVELISVSIDPMTDTPARLKSWSARFGARAGWTLLTGSNSDVERLLKSLGVYSANRFSHAPIALVGSDASGRWERVSGLLPPEKFVAIIDGLRAHSSNREATTK